MSHVKQECVCAGWCPFVHINTVKYWKSLPYWCSFLPVSLSASVSDAHSSSVSHVLCEGHSLSIYNLSLALLKETQNCVCEPACVCVPLAILPSSLQLWALMLIQEESQKNQSITHKQTILSSGLHSPDYLWWKMFFPGVELHYLSLSNRTMVTGRHVGGNTNFLCKLLISHDWLMVSPVMTYLYIQRERES